MVRWLLGLSVVLFGIATAAAQPVRYELRGAVPVGEKPAIKFTAAQAVTSLQLELSRDDGKKFTLKHRALASGQSVTLAVGDGKPGNAAYKGALTVQVVGQGPWRDQFTFETAVRAPIKVKYDADHLDLDKRVLQFKVSRAIEKAELIVVGENGNDLGSGAASFTGDPGDKWLAISWTQPPTMRVLSMKLRVSAADGTVSTVELIPWSVAIDHEDVTFATDSAVVRPGETAKLDASLVKIAEVIKTSGKFMKMRLYIAGHTDTVGAGPKNRKLSVDRALAIGAYFRKKGLSIPVAVAGFGEDVLAVKTADNTDEAANRRADYVLGPAAGSPPFKGPYLRVKAGWKQLP
ncbi:MAG: OmpA family protein [Kofleriaceae bacterium]